MDYRSTSSRKAEMANILIFKYWLKSYVTH